MQLELDYANEIGEVSNWAKNLNKRAIENKCFIENLIRGLALVNYHIDQLKNEGETDGDGYTCYLKPDDTGTYLDEDIHAMNESVDYCVFQSSKLCLEIMRQVDSHYNSNVMDVDFGAFNLSNTLIDLREKLGQENT